jgi:uncharacterized protein DUF4129
VVENTRDWGRRNYGSLLGYARWLRSRITRDPRKWSMGVLLVTVIVISLANLQRLVTIVRSRRIASHPERSPQTAAAIWYTRMTRVLARRGWRKSPSQTPSEFLLMIEEPKLHSRVQEFTRRYERARFNDSSEDAQQLPDLYEEINAQKK